MRVGPIPTLLVSMLSIQGGAAIAKGLFPYLGAVGTTGVRIVFAALLTLAVVRPPVRRLVREHAGLLAAYGVALGAMNLTFYMAIARIPLGLGVALEFCGPLALTVWLSRRGLDFAWVLLAAAGLALLTPWNQAAESLDPVGVALALFAGACWAAYIVVGGRLSRRLPAATATSLGLLSAAVVVLPFALADGVVQRIDVQTAAAGLAVAVLSSAIPYTLEMSALSRLPVRTFGVLMSLEPAVAAMMGLLFLSEMLGPSQWIAIACVSAASAGAAVTAARNL